MTFGTEWGWGSDEKESRAVFDAYIEAGGNFVDTANLYTGGMSERFLGEFIKDRRDEIVLATKYTLNMRPGDPNAGGNHRKSLVQSIEGSLRRLDTSYIDLFWVHSWDFITPVDEIMRALDDLVRAGSVLYIGVSNPPAWAAAQANTLAELRGWTSFVGMQMQYSLVERAVEREVVPMCREFGIGITPWSPLGGGLLTGKYARIDAGSKAKIDESLRQDSNKGRLTEKNARIIETVAAVASEAERTPAQVALRWLLQRPGVDSVILGARTPAQLADNLGAMDFELGTEHMARLDRVSAIELGYPHDFLASDSVQKYMFGGAKIEGK